MKYYPFHIGDYHAHTQHLDPLEDIAYRRMLDLCFLHESGLPETVEEIARLIRMRSHCDCIAVVLREFFTQQSDGTWHSERVDKEVAAFREKSDKAANSARKRWGKHDANALRTHSEGNANQNQNQNQNQNHGKDISVQAGKPAAKAKRAKLPEDFDLNNQREQAAKDYWSSKGRADLDAADQFERFTNHHRAHGKAMADWDAAWRTWYTNAVSFSKPSYQDAKQARRAQLEHEARNFYKDDDSEGATIEGECSHVR